MCAKLPHWWIRQTRVGNAPLPAALSVIVICAGTCASLFAAKSELHYLRSILIKYFLPQLAPHIPSTSSKHGEKTHYFRNRNKTQQKQEQRGARNAKQFLGKSLADSGLFFNVLMTEALERRDAGKITKSRPDQALGIWAKGVAEDKCAHLMCRN